HRAGGRAAARPLRAAPRSLATGVRVAPGADRVAGAARARRAAAAVLGGAPAPLPEVRIQPEPLAAAFGAAVGRPDRRPGSDPRCDRDGLQPVHTDPLDQAVGRGSTSVRVPFK